jgi:hypothetical protein
MKKIANQIITEVKYYMLDYEISEGQLDIEIDDIMITLNFKGDVSEIHDKYREGHENRNFKVIVDSIYITEFWDDEELNEEKRTELNNLLNEIL